jgi:putative tryptophan/tyrosine transport system substrate-binding protein
MNRRAVITGLGSAVMLPFAARAQQAMPVVGLVRSTPSASFGHLVAALREGLAETGFVEGRNVVIEQRWAEGQIERLPALVHDLLRQRVAVLVTNNVATLTAKAATKTVPIVFSVGTDPIQDGLVTSLNRPGGNVTGVSFLTGILGSKRLEIIRQIVPKAAPIGMLVHPGFAETEGERRDVQEAARTVGQELIVLDAINSAEVEAAFAAMAGRGARAVIVGTGPFLNSRRPIIIAGAARYRLPAIYPLREFADEGGLMSYGTSQADGYRHAGIYAGRILKGEKPGDLPVLQATKFEFIINLKTARALGIEFHPQLLATADEAIE